MGKKSKKGTSRAGGLKNKKAKRNELRTGSFKKATAQDAEVMPKISAPPVSPTSGAELDLQTLDASKSTTPLPLNDPSGQDELLVVYKKEPALDMGASTVAGKNSTSAHTAVSLTEPSLSETKDNQRGCDCAGCIIL